MDLENKPQPSKSVDSFLGKENFIVKKNGQGHKIQWENFDTIIYDADETIWTCVTKDGDNIGAYQTKPPYKLNDKDPNTCHDSVGNHIIAKDGFLDQVRHLKSLGKGVFMCSHSEDMNVPEEEQPVNQILVTFGIFDCFDDVIIDGDAPKSEYVQQLQSGETLFVDDDVDNLSDVANNTTDVVPLDATKITFEAKSWYKTVIANVVEND